MLTDHSDFCSSLAVGHLSVWVVEVLLVCITVSWKVECGLWKKGQQYYQDTQRYCTAQMQGIMSARLPPCVNLFSTSYEHGHRPVQTCSLPHAIAFAAFFAASCNHIRLPLRMF